MKISVSPLTPPVLLFGAAYLGSSVFLPTLLCSAVHEAGHIAAAVVCGERIRSVKLLPFGAEIKFFGIGSYGKQAALILGGPAAGLLLCAAAFAFGLHTVALTSLFLSLFNLLPIKGFDGSRFLLAVFKSEDSPVTDAVSAVFSLILWLISVGILLGTGQNLALFLFCVMLFLQS